jgi:hypothetical protein
MVWSHCTDIVWLRRNAICDHYFPCLCVYVRVFMLEGVFILCASASIVGGVNFIGAMAFIVCCFTGV